MKLQLKNYCLGSENRSAKSKALGYIFLAGKLIRILIKNFLFKKEREKYLNKRVKYVCNVTNISVLTGH